MREIYLWIFYTFLNITRVWSDLHFNIRFLISVFGDKVGFAEIYIVLVRRINTN